MVALGFLSTDGNSQRTNSTRSEPFAMTGNDAYTAVIATERNESYMTNIDVISAARNEAYGAVATELEDGNNSFNREGMHDSSHTESQSQTAHDQGIDDHSYDYVY